MSVADCVSYRENLLIIAGLVVILFQMLLYYADRRHFRQIINRSLPPAPLVDYSHRDGD